MKTLTATVVTATMAMSAGQTMAAAAAAPAAPAAAAAAAAPIVHGPPITGLCVLYTAAARSTAQYGKAIDARLDAINAAANTELKGLQDKINTDGNTLNANRATMTELQYNTAVLTLQDKQTSFQATVNLRQQELDATEQYGDQVFSDELQKVATKVYQDQKCSILLDRGSGVMSLNPSMDITDAVIKAMDQDKTTVTPFAKVTLPAAPAATGGTKG